VLSLSDRITVLRDGQVAASLDREQVKQTSEQQLAGMMVGRTMGHHFPPRAVRRCDVMLDVKNLSVPGGVSGLVHDVSFSIHAGEIVGFAGLIGAGRTETAEALAGLRARNGGTITLGGLPIDARSPWDAVEQGIAYLPEDRKGSGLTLPMPIIQNITLASLRRYSRGLIRGRLERKAATAQAQRLLVKSNNLNASVGTLSGGNQQKVLLAKWLDTQPRLLIVDEPTRGVDIGAREEIYRLLRELTDGGLACMMISSDLNEVLGMSDRILVMREGRIVATLDGGRASEESVMRYAAGVEEAVV
jgi:ribose transport system ATP-binding protein